MGSDHSLVNQEHTVAACVGAERGSESFLELQLQVEVENSELETGGASDFSSWFLVAPTSAFSAARLNIPFHNESGGVKAPFYYFISLLRLIFKRCVSFLSFLLSKLYQNQQGFPDFFLNQYTLPLLPCITNHHANVQTILLRRPRCGKYSVIYRWVGERW